MRVLAVINKGKFKIEDETKYGTIHTWYFNLHSVLRLNITFHQIQIMYMNLYKCLIGRVYLVSYTDFKKSENIYCGIHSLIVNYPFFRKVNVGIKSLYTVQ